MLANSDIQPESTLDKKDLKTIAFKLQKDTYNRIMKYTTSGEYASLSEFIRLACLDFMKELSYLKKHGSTFWQYEDYKTLDSSKKIAISVKVPINQFDIYERYMIYFNFRDRSKFFRTAVFRLVKLEITN